MLKVLYNGQYFDSIADLKQKYEAGTVEKIKYKTLLNYASLKPKEKPTGIGSQQFYVQGKRYSIKNNHNRIPGLELCLWSKSTQKESPMS